MPYDPKLPSEDSLINEAPAEIRENFRSIKEADGFVHTSVLIGDTEDKSLKISVVENTDKSKDLQVSKKDGSSPVSFLKYATPIPSMGTDKMNAVFARGDFDQLYSGGVPIAGGQGIFHAYAVFNGTTTVSSDGLKVWVLSPGVYIVQPTDSFFDVVKRKGKRFCLSITPQSQDVKHGVEYPSDFAGDQRYKVTLYSYGGNVVAGGFSAQACV